ncbi:T9SS type A sorting domain-containing protein, partial [Flavobacterium sp.]|uniref:T9SS type A sorting domain-containing protein n=1 Tax=Flavobacterium sp. TaxID=239 RepID=UPI0039E5EA4E
VLKLDRRGNVEWEKVIGGDRDDQLFAVRQTFDGGYILGGNSNSSPTHSKTRGNGKGTDFWIVKLDASGEMLWQETYDFGTSDILTSIVENRDHTLLIGGYAKSEPDTKRDDKGINDYIALKVSEKGVVLWQKTVGSDGDDALRKLVETRDGGYILAGTSSPIRSMQVKNSNKKNPNSKGESPVKLGNGKPNQQIKENTDAVNEQINETAEAFNKDYNKAVGGTVDKVNNAVGSGKDSSLQYGINQPKSPLGKAPSLGTGGSAGDALGGLMDSMGNSQPTLPPSGDKTNNYGYTDFWVVKLRDKMKAPNEKGKSLEAMPNPTNGYTNVIVNYEYESGTATVVDVSGHVLDTFPITGRTVPVDLGKYPEGIYVINIMTDDRSEGVKVIRRK